MSVPSQIFAQLSPLYPEQLVSQRYTNYASILVQTGTDLLYNQGNYTQALKYFDKALSVDPNNMGAIFFKGLR
jgi:tetratricopeptide (TPR) repeat protein